MKQQTAYQKSKTEYLIIVKAIEYANKYSVESFACARFVEHAETFLNARYAFAVTPAIRNRALYAAIDAKNDLGRWKRAEKALGNAAVVLMSYDQFLPVENKEG